MLITRITFSYALIAVKYKKDTGKHWHSLHNLLWGNKINQDILETLNELNHQDDHFIDTDRKLNKTV